jgi:hypothetical protein
MGADFYPKTLIGIRIPMEKIRKKEKYEELKKFTKSSLPWQKDPEHLKCPTFEMKEGMRNCPYCGASLYERGIRTIYLVPGLILEDDNYEAQSYKDWKMATDSDYNYLFIGFYCIEGDQESECACVGIKQEIDTEEIITKKALLKADMEEVDLWDESEFGLWLFMFNSY